MCVRADLKVFYCGEDTYFLSAMVEGLLEHVHVLLRLHLPHANRLARPPLGLPFLQQRKGKASQDVVECATQGSLLIT
jgi:hypothetical protein